MNKLIPTLILAGLPVCVSAIEVVAPQELQASSFQISDPDRHVKTLGEVDFIIDLSAAHDDLLALKVRRSSLTLKDERPFSAFGVHKDAGIVVIAGGDVSHISVASVEDKQGTQEASVLFYGSSNQVISPDPRDVAVFDLDFKPLSFSYTPLQAPGSLEIPVSIALDTSGSMDGYMDSVIAATKEFMRELPEFTKCRLFNFDDDVYELSPSSFDALTSCPTTAYLLDKKLEAGGSTALYKAIRSGFASDKSHSKGSFPNINIIVTDGINTVNYGDSLKILKADKGHSNSKLFVFWAGNYEQGYLQDIADLEFVSTLNLDTELDRFFHSLGVSISGLQTLHIEK